MTLPARAVEIVHALYTAHPQDDAARRIAIRRVGEQCAFELGPQWGNKKRAGLSDDFRSPDTLACLEADGSVSAWDVQASSGQILVHAGDPPTHPNLSPADATFMPCTPVNHLGGNPLPGETPASPPPSVDLGPVLAQLDALQLQVDGLAAVISALVRKPDVTFPVYEGTVAIKYLGTGRAYLEPK